MIGYGATGVTHDFFCYNSSGQVWNGSAFANWSAGSFASYRVTATELSGSGRFTGTAPTGTVSWELRVRAATLAGSYVVYEGNDTQDEVKKIPRAASALTAGGSSRRTKAAATSTTLDETIGATP